MSQAVQEPPTTRERKRREGSKGQTHKEEEREIGRGTGGQGPLAQLGELHLDICVGDPEFLITPLFMGPVCLLSQGRFTHQQNKRALLDSW